MPAADIPVLGLSNLKVFHRFGSAYFLGEKKKSLYPWYHISSLDGFL
jgi:hypothetical protein